MRITVFRRIPRPVTLVNDDVVAWGRYPSRREWAHALGTVRRHEQAAVTT
jgi:hypothetical protein